MPPDPPDEPSDEGASRPVRADVTTTATAGGVLVAVALRNDTAVDLRVRVGNDLDGPVLPPRRAGVPAAGWDEAGFTGVVPANGRLGLGYACPVSDDGAGGWQPSGSDPDPDPISLEVLGPADGDEPPAPDHVAAAVRSLGRATPPADAVPASSTADADRPATDRGSRRRGGHVGSNRSDLPPQVAAWLDAVETRIERAERLTDATAEEAAAVLEDCGGVDDVVDLPDDVEADLTSLRAADDRIAELLERAAAADADPVVSSLAAAADGEAPAATSGEWGSTPREAGRGSRHSSGVTR